MRFVTLAVAVLLVACSGTEPNDPDLRLGIQLDRAMIALDDSVRLSLTLTNTSSRTIKVFPANAYGICMHAFEVRDRANREVSVAQGFCVAVDIVMPAPVDLRPLEQIVITDWWRPRDSTLDGAPLLPGTYVLRGRAWADQRTAYSGRRPVMLQ